MREETRKQATNGAVLKSWNWQSEFKFHDELHRPQDHRMPECLVGRMAESSVRINHHHLDCEKYPRQFGDHNLDSQWESLLQHVMTDLDASCGSYN